VGDAFDVYNSWAADDFVCKRSVRHLRKIVILGQYHDSGWVGDAIDLRVLRNDPSGEVDEPSDDKVVCAFPEQSFEQFSWIGTVVVRPKGIPCHLKAGHDYWLDVQMRMGGDDFGFWGWEITSLGNGAVSDWRNPADGFAVGCTTYSGAGTGGDRSTSDCFDSEFPVIDLMFSIR
jgi:hypothetical protein